MDPITPNSAIRMPAVATATRTVAAVLAGGSVDLFHIDDHSVSAAVRDPRWDEPVGVDMLLDGEGAFLCAVCEDPGCVHVAAVLDLLGVLS